jgi:hypothetical protein
MPITSTPVTTQSSVNLSDINIDTDLNLGTNKVIVSSISDIKVGSSTLNKLIPTLNINETTNCQNLAVISSEILNDNTTYETASSSITILLTYTFTEDYSGYIRIKNKCIAVEGPTTHYLYHNTTSLKSIAGGSGSGSDLEYVFYITAVTNDTITFRAKVDLVYTGRYARINGAIIQKLDLISTKL